MAEDMNQTNSEEQNTENATTQEQPVEVQPVQVNEKPEEKAAEVSAMPSVEKQPSFFEKNKALIIIAGVAVIGIALLILIISLIVSSVSGSKNVETPLVYLTTDGELKFVTSGKKQGVTMASSYTESLDVAYSNKSNRYILYTKSDNLYLVDTRKSGDGEKITSDVDEFMFSENDKYVVFTNDDGDLYAYNFKDKEKLDSDVSSIRAVSADKVFYKKDGNLYMRSLKASKDDKEKIASDIKYAYFNENMTKVLYSKENNDDLYDYYVYNIKSKKDEKVIEDAYTIYDYNDDFTKFIYGVENEGSTFDLSKIVDDDKAESDKNFKAYTYDDYLDGTVEYSEYRESLSESYDVKSREKIREQLKEEFKLDPTIEVYFQTGNKKTKITEDASSILYADAETKRVVYATETYDTSKKIKLSEVSYFYKIKNYLEDNKKETVMFKVGDKEATEVVSNADDADVYVIKNDLYYTVDDELFYAKISGNKLGKAQSLAEDTKIIDSTGEYRDSLVFATDVKSYTGDLKLAKAGKVTAIDNDVYTKGITITDTNKIYYYTDFEDNSGDYNMFNGKVKNILKDVGYVYHVKDNYMYVFKDYSSKSSSYDLYRYKGSKLQLIDYGVSKAY